MSPQESFSLSRPGTIADVKVGEVVRGTRIKLGDNYWEVVSLLLGPKQKVATD